MDGPLRVAVPRIAKRKSPSKRDWIPSLFSYLLEGARASTGLCVDVGSGVMI